MVNQAVKDFDGRVEVVKLNLDNEETLRYAQKYQVNVIPTYVFLDSNGTMTDKAVGALKRDDLYARLRAIEGE